MDDARSWGPWRLRTDNYTLEILRADGTFRYGVDLERCRTSAQALDWIYQVAHKQWATDEILVQLVRALDDVLRPQQNLCSMGASAEIESDRLRDLVVQAATPPRP